MIAKALQNHLAPRNGGRMGKNAMGKSAAKSSNRFPTDSTDILRGRAINDSAMHFGDLRPRPDCRKQNGGNMVLVESC